MGAWSHEPFGNDTAADWAYGLDEATDLSYIEAALDNALDAGDEYLEADEAEEAIAAMEVLAKLLGKGSQSDTYTEAVDAWVASTAVKPQPSLLKKALQVIDRILADDSELMELWQESDHFEAWQGMLGKLRTALNS